MTPWTRTNDLVDLSVQTDIQGYDIDGDIVRAAERTRRQQEWMS